MCSITCTELFNIYTNNYVRIRALDQNTQAPLHPPNNDCKGPVSAAQTTRISSRYEFMKISHPLSKRLASLGIIGDQLRAPLKPHNEIVP